MKLQIIQIEHFDNLFSIKEKLIHSKAESLLLIDQNGSPILQDKKQAILIKRIVLQTGKEIGIVTQNTIAASILKEAGLNTFYDINSAQQFQWGSNNKTQRDYWPSKKNRSHFLKNNVRGSQLSPWVRIASFVAGIASILILVVIFFPSAEITIKVPVSTQSIQIPADVDSKNISKGSNPLVLLPTFVEVEVFRTIKVSGSKNVPVSKAKGKIDLINLTNDVVQIPEGLILGSSVDEKKEYITTEPGEISGGPNSLLSLPVEALQAGAAGNAEVGEVTSILGSFGLRLASRNSKAIEGGSDTEKPYPSAEDTNKLQADCIEDLKNDAFAKIQKSSGPDVVILPETLEITEILIEDYFPVGDSPADVLSLTMRAKVSILTLQKDMIIVYSKPYLDALLPDNYSASGDITFNKVEVEKINPDGSIKVVLTVSRIIKREINSEEIKEFSSGRSKNEVAQAIEQQFQLSAPGVISVHPGWLQVLPMVPFRINVRVEE